MSCDKPDTEEIIEQYVGGTLPSAEMEAFDEHCFSCPDCFRALRLREEIIAVIRENGPVLYEDVPEKKKAAGRQARKTLSRWNRLFSDPGFRWVTVAAGAAMILLVLILRPAGESPVRIAGRFTPHPYLEEMCTDVTRSGSFTILSPLSGEIFRGDMLFEWQGLGDESVDLVILDNTGEELFRFTTDLNRYRFKQKLTPGLYYWKLETADELMHVGKFSAEQNR
ncbi:hypothetical protein JW948_08540 [bacterium]|nr:hypothetical protein [bacterium]